MVLVRVRAVEEEMEVAAASLLLEVRAVKAWVELEKSRIAGSAEAPVMLPPAVSEQGELLVGERSFA